MSHAESELEVVKFLASIAFDFHAAEVVDTMQLVSAKIPKSLFAKPRER